MVDLHDLVNKGDLEGVRKFLERSASKVNKTNRDGQTALHCSAKGGHVEVCRELISSVASVDVEDKQNRTPLRVAVENNKAEVARVLCEAGASTSLAIEPERRTPLHFAANKGFTACAEVLLRHGAVIEGNPDKWGHLPDEDCATSDIRILIETTRKERAAGARKYEPQSATAPPSAGEDKPEGASVTSSFTSSDHAPPSYHEAVSLSQFVGAERGGQGGSTPSPLSQARQAAAVGGEHCAACNAPERSRQLTPCHHIVCGACAKRSRGEDEDRCPVCSARVFDDNPLFS